MEFPTPEEISNYDDVSDLTWQCFLAIRKYFVMYKQKKCLISVNIGSYSDETINIVIEKLINSGWCAEPKEDDKADYLIIKDKRDIL